MPDVRRRAAASEPETRAQERRRRRALSIETASQGQLIWWRFRRHKELIPGIFVVLAVLMFSFVGDGLRDAADPYQ